jgi:hypothetical protein
VCGVTEDQVAGVGGEDVQVEGLLDREDVKGALARSEENAPDGADRLRHIVHIKFVGTLISIGNQYNLLPYAKREQTITSPVSGSRTAARRPARFA